MDRVRVYRHPLRVSRSRSCAAENHNEDQAPPSLRAFWQRAEFALGVVFRLDGEHAIEARTGVFPRNHGAQLDKFALRKVRSQGLVQLVRDIGRRARHRNGKPQNRFLSRIEMCTRFELRQIEKLFFRDALSSAASRMAVDSKRAPRHRRDLKLRQFF